MAEEPGPSLRTYVETRFNLLTTEVDRRLEELDKRYQQRWEATEKAILKAEGASERRFEGVNEFRNTLSDQQRTLMPRSEVEVMRDSMAERVNALKEQMDRLLAERQGIKGGWALAAGAVTFVLGLALFVLRLIGK